MTKRLLALLMALAMCLSLAACGNKDDDPTNYGGVNSDDPSASQSADPDAAESSDIEVDLTQTMYSFSSGMDDSAAAVTVNGVSIPNELFFYWLSYDCYYIYSMYAQYGMTADFNEDSTREYLMSDVQNAVTYHAILRQLCEENGITVTDEQLADYTAQLDELISESYDGDKSLALKSYGLSEDSFQYINTNGYLFTNLTDQLVGEPSDADLDAYVEENGIFGVKHILLLTTTTDITDDDGNVTQTADEYNAQQKAMAESLLERLQDPAAADSLFDELMAAYSEDTGLSSYPDGYTYSNDDSLVSGFREAALELEVGEISGIVETDYGYHILLRLPIDSADYHDEWLSAKGDALITSAMESAEVTVNEALSDLDINTFFERYMAYGLEFYNQLNPTVEE